MLPVQAGIEGAVLFRNEVFRCLIAGIPQGTSDDLFYFAVVYIDAGTKFHDFVPFSGQRSMPNRFRSTDSSSDRDSRTVSRMSVPRVSLNVISLMEMLPSGVRRLAMRCDRK